MEEAKNKNNSNLENDKAKQNNSNQEKLKTIKYSCFGGFLMALLLIFLNIGTIAAIIIHLNFLIDSKKYNFDKIGLTRLGKNTHFSLCTLYSCVDSWYSSFFANIAIFFVLFFQEIVMTSKWIRLTILKRTIGDFFHCPKYIIRIMSLFNFCMIIMLYQPMNFADIEVYPKLDLNEYFHPAFLLLPLLVGSYLIISSLYYHLVLNDELGFILLYKIIKGIPVEKAGDFLYGQNIYERIRSPFRAGFMLILLSFNSKWDLGRLVYTGFFWFALYIEGVNDDRFYFERYDIYREYIRNVPCRFFDLSFLTGKPKNKKMDNKKNNEEPIKNEPEKVKHRRNKKKQE